MRFCVGSDDLHEIAIQHLLRLFAASPYAIIAAYSLNRLYSWFAPKLEGQDKGGEHRDLTDGLKSSQQVVNDGDAAQVEPPPPSG